MGNVLILSVPHTGTVFLSELLSTRTGLVTSRQHCHYSGIFDWLAGRPNLTICTPLRRPEDCWRTWCSRKTGDADSFVEAWRNLDRIRRERVVILLPIDHPEREIYLNLMSERLGVTLRTDWTPKNTGERLECPPMPTLDVEITRIYENVPRL